jgi:hypothetical protein
MIVVDLIAWTQHLLLHGEGRAEDAALPDPARRSEADPAVVA